jgi:hypothetical protein
MALDIEFRWLIVSLTYPALSPSSMATGLKRIHALVKQEMISSVLAND